MDDPALHAALHWFPLTGHARPACPPLPERIRELGQMAGPADGPDANALPAAACTMNKAALLASDCGLPELARDLCRQHISTYLHAGRPLAVQEARGILGPALNLARLSLREDDPATALRLLATTYQAVMTGTDATLDGQVLPLAGITGTGPELRRLREDTWLQYLSEASRAYARLGQWDQAAAHAGTHRGIGSHLLDGRQALIISRITSGNPGEARRLLAESAVSQPWERHVASCLNVLCAADEDRGKSARVMTTLFLESCPVPGYIVFRARIALAIAAMLHRTHPCRARQVARKAAEEATDAGDGYAARDLIGYLPSPDCLATGQRENLSRLVDASGLDAGHLSRSGMEAVTGAAGRAAARLRALLAPAAR